MTDRTRQMLVPCTFAACAAFAMLFAGCGRDESATTDAVSAPGSAAVPAATEETESIPRLADPVYKEALSKQTSEKIDLLKTRDLIAGKMQKREAEVRAGLASSDEAAVAAALAKDAELMSLRSRLVDLTKALEDNRRRSTALVRERIHADLKKNKDNL